ncbi:MAG: cell division protein SepF [Archaeoglobus sp.]|nr:cell division protein SepF [Archaeoglobus sp.]
MGIMDKLLGKSERLSVEEYEELDLGEYEAEIVEEAEILIKVAEVTGLNEVPEIRRQIYEGNIVIADIAFLRHDKLTLDRILKDLRQLAEDVNGDIVGLGEDYVVVTPTGIRVDRNKIRGIKK